MYELAIVVTWVFRALAVLAIPTILVIVCVGSYVDFFSDDN